MVHGDSCTPDDAISPVEMLIFADCVCLAANELTNGLTGKLVNHTWMSIIRAK
jgi:hypothetical protein